MKNIKRIILMTVATLSPVMAEDIQPVKEPVKGPVKIFLLSGQSNMTGRGTLGNLRTPPEVQEATLVRYIMEPGNKEKYASLYSDPAKPALDWVPRDDVFITIGEWPHLKPGEEGYNNGRKHGGLKPYYGGFRNKGFGPELGIGYVLGNFYEEPVLLVKSSFGANSLGKNFRPPSSGGDLGDKYPVIVKAVHDAIDHLPEIMPGYTEQTGYEIVGFLWNQGVHDMNEEFAAEYETNLVNLINDLRKEFHAPEMKVVVAVTGNFGWDLADLLKWQKTEAK
ncbi:MAG: sialate O-acetylesterase, partial [Opitutales bacterium]